MNNDMVSVLDARRAAIEKFIKEAGGEKNADGTTDSTRAILIELSIQATGFGFDEGVRYVESTQPKA